MLACQQLICVLSFQLLEAFSELSVLQEDFIYCKLQCTGCSRGSKNKQHFNE